MVRNPCGSRDQGAINLRSGTPQGGCLLLCFEPKTKTKRETRKTKQEQEHQNSDPGVEPKTARDDCSAFGRFAIRVHPRTTAPPKLEFYVNMYFSDERGVMRGDVSCFLVSAAFAQRRAPLQGATSSHSTRGSQQAKAGESPARAALSFLR